jgi:hypothetical protein
MKKAGMGGNTGKGHKPGIGTVAVDGASGGGQKRGRRTKIARKTHEEESEGEGGEENEVKNEPEDESDGEAKSLAKKTKVDVAKDLEDGKE